MLHNRVHGIYLAAGQSSRMGVNKLKLRLGDMSLGSYALHAAINSNLDYVWVIAGDAGADWIDSSFFEEPMKRKWSAIYCPEASKGQAYSLRCGIEAAISMETAAVMIFLADQPLVTSEMINELLQRYDKESAYDRSVNYVASASDGLPRPPVIFGQRMYPDLLRLQGDQGARYLIRQGIQGICLEFDDPDLFMDVDTEEDYRFLLAKTGILKS
ncbi:nucleotidyltransferase family protein [Paenibacillus lutimineralis]|uniref:Nucleotidyltransferase family protein n=1 Tax=Paenibacillus lutimineralis TaxID=2707005 RepID=A0A3Q9I9N1_9BACL|nr:nucleotidyltransferase family protein [Paenibacillus lutimineralis]AZS15876.1 nucleotidyltransferase family protein [Paenibacillus lutimineralis]